jgi:spore coat protein U-like protein
MDMTRTIKTILMVVVMGLTATAGFAQTTTTNDDNITATVDGSCRIENFALDFGNYDPIDAGNLEESGNIQVFCTKGVTPDVNLDMGTRNDRTMKHVLEADVLDYELYTTAARDVTWPVAPAPGVQTATAAVDPTQALTLTIFGRVFAGQAAQAGDYTDTVRATVNW